MPAIPSLSPDDLRLLQEAISFARKSLSKTPNRPFVPEEVGNFPEVYVALTPPFGIPALSEEDDPLPGTAYGTGTSGERYDIPGSATCLVYRVLPLAAEPGTGTTGQAETLVMQPVDGLTRNVFNVSTTGIAGDRLVLIERDKFGTWWVESSGEATGVTINLVTNVCPIYGITSGSITPVTDNTLGTPANELVQIIGSGDDPDINNNFATLQAEIAQLQALIQTAMTGITVEKQAIEVLAAMGDKSCVDNPSNCCPGGTGTGGGIVTGCSDSPIDEHLSFTLSTTNPLFPASFNNFRYSASLGVDFGITDPQGSFVQGWTDAYILPHDEPPCAVAGDEVRVFLWCEFVAGPNIWRWQLAVRIGLGAIDCNLFVSSITYAPFNLTINAISCCFGDSGTGLISGVLT